MYVPHFKMQENVYEGIKFLSFFQFISLWSLVLLLNRSSHPEVFCKKGVLRNFAKFKGKHLCQSLFFKKEALAQVFSGELCKISKNTFFTEHLLSFIMYKRKKKESIRIFAYFSLFSLSPRKQIKRFFFFFFKKKNFRKYCILKTSCESFLMKFLKVNNFLRNYLQKQPPDMFCIKRYSKHFASFTGKHLCLSLLWSLQ